MHPGITGTYAPDAIVGGVNSDTSGKGEVALDLEVAMAAAPDAQLRAYIAPNDPNFAPVVFDQMRQDGVDIISDSWGACEPLITPRLLAAENTSLELAAVAGISTFVATGDFGIDRLLPVHGLHRPVRRRPVLTAVRNRGRRDGARGAAGVRSASRDGLARVGRAFRHWPKPGYQLGKTVPVPAAVSAAAAPHSAGRHPTSR